MTCSTIFGSGCWLFIWSKPITSPCLLRPANRKMRRRMSGKNHLTLLSNIWRHLFQNQVLLLAVWSFAQLKVRKGSDCQLRRQRARRHCSSSCDHLMSLFLPNLLNRSRLVLFLFDAFTLSNLHFLRLTNSEHPVWSKEPPLRSHCCCSWPWWAARAWFFQPAADKSGLRCPPRASTPGPRSYPSVRPAG